MKLLVWLGNPWDKYKKTRHNIWFIMLDKICEYYKFTDFSFNSKYNGEISSWEILWEKIVAIKPQTYMNLSGDCVSKIMNFYKLSSLDVISVYDDIDMENAKVRIRQEWSAWWHNWVSDLIRKLWSDKFYRIKIWVWRSPHPNVTVADYVLSNFTEDQLSEIFLKFDEIKNHLEKIISWN